MDVNLADFAAQSQQDPVARQAMLAQMIRAQQTGAGQDQIAAATARARGMDPMVAAASMSNNPGLLAAAQTAQKSTQAQYAPHQMGTQGFMLPDTGSFVESPVYGDEKRMQREMITENQAARMDQNRYALQQTLETRRQLQEQALAARADQNEMNRALRLTLGSFGNDLRRERFENTKSQQQQHNVQEFGKTLDKSGLPQISDAVGSINEMLQAPEGKLPGIGYGQKTLSEIPLVSDWTVGSEGKLNRSRVQKLVNAMTLTEAGKAVTKNEEVRQAIVNMSSDKYNEKDFRNAWNKVILPAIENVRANRHRSFDPTVVEDYVGNAPGGFDPRASFLPQQAAATPKRIKFDAQGNPMP